MIRAEAEGVFDLSPELTLLVQALVILTVPVAVWRYFGLRHAVPLVCVQISCRDRARSERFRPSRSGAVSPRLQPGGADPDLGHRLDGGVAVRLCDRAAPRTGRDPARRTLVCLCRGQQYRAFRRSPVFSAGCGLPRMNPAEVGDGIGRCRFRRRDRHVSIGVTALPVLGAILREMDLLGHRLGDLALGIAAVERCGVVAVSRRDHGGIRRGGVGHLRSDRSACAARRYI